MVTDLLYCGNNNYCTKNILVIHVLHIMTMTMDLFQLRAHEGQKIIGEILHTMKAYRHIVNTHTACFLASVYLNRL